MNSNETKYKSTLINSVSWTEQKSSWTEQKSSSNDLENLDKFLENEKNNNLNEPWGKLDKTAKIKKLILFAKTYSIDNNFTPDECQSMIDFFKDCLDRKKLQRVKDVTYNKETGEITHIAALHYIKATNHFTLKNVDKRVSTVRGLAPKKKQGTIKHIIDSDSEKE
jgi:hypothetical protein